MPKLSALHLAHRPPKVGRRNNPMGDVNFDAGRLYRPNPKGGAENAFTIPLSGASTTVGERRERSVGPLLGTCPRRCRSCSSPDLCAKIWRTTRPTSPRASSKKRTDATFAPFTNGCRSTAERDGECILRTTFGIWAIEPSSIEVHVSHRVVAASNFRRPMSKM